MSLYLIGTSNESFKYHKNHFHNQTEIILNYEGEGISNINGKEYKFRPGTIHIINKKVKHSKSSKTGFRDIFFQTDDIKIEEDVLILDDDNSKTIEKLLSILLPLYIAKENNDIVFNSLYEALITAVNFKILNKQRNSTVDKICHELRINFSDYKLNIENLLSQSGYSSDHIRRLFKNETGLTPLEYLTKIRIDYSKELMDKNKDLHMTISEISLSCGFFDPRYFSRIFKEKNGMTPSDYLKNK